MDSTILDQILIAIVSVGATITAFALLKYVYFSTKTLRALVYILITTGYFIIASAYQFFMIKRRHVKINSFLDSPTFQFIHVEFQILGCYLIIPIIGFIYFLSLYSTPQLANQHKRGVLSSLNIAIVITAYKWILVFVF